MAARARSNPWVLFPIELEVMYCMPPIVKESTAMSAPAEIKILNKALIRSANPPEVVSLELSVTPGMGSSGV